MTIHAAKQSVVETCLYVVIAPLTFSKGSMFLCWSVCKSSHFTGIVLSWLISVSFQMENISFTD